VLPKYRIAEITGKLKIGTTEELIVP